MSIIDNIFGDKSQVNDQFIANSSLFALKGTSGAYLAAILESATPEVRRLYSDYLTQSILAHESLTALAVNKGWYKPYLNPQEQISTIFEQSEKVIRTEA